MNAATWARGLVADWTLLLVRGLPEAVARDRFDEIASDLWEQQHEAETLGRSSIGTAPSILLRAARGIPADLIWRATAGRRAAAGMVPVRLEGAVMSRKPNPAAKPWVHLTDTEKPFDQTNGVVDFDVEDKHDPNDPTLTLLEKGAATSVLSMGGLGLGG